MILQHVVMSAAYPPNASAKNKKRLTYFMFRLIDGTCEASPLGTKAAMSEGGSLKGQ
jgi:hypothetical protein